MNSILRHSNASRSKCFIFTFRVKKLGSNRLQAKYICHFGYEMTAGRRRIKRHLIKKNKNLICKNGLWVGRLPSCRKKRQKTKQNRCKSCDQLCFKTNRKSSEIKCGCFKGFDLVNNSFCVGKIRSKRKLKNKQLFD
jgi:hypothetical protein